MAMQVLFDAEVTVAHHAFWVHSDDWPTGDGRGGQQNGLCGAAEPGALAFTTGLEDGDLPVRMEWHDREPPLDPAWPEVVEVSFAPAGPRVHLQEWHGDTVALALDRGDYRVRYCAAGFDNETDGVLEPPERCLVQFWPAAPAPDRVVRQTSDRAARWHAEARKTPPPPSAQQRAEAGLPARPEPPGA